MCLNCLQRLPELRFQRQMNMFGARGAVSGRARTFRESFARVVAMLNLSWTVGEAFFWGVVTATLCWVALAVISAGVLGVMIRRSDQAADAEERLLAAQQHEIQEAARSLYEPSERELVPSQSGTRFKAVGSDSGIVTPSVPMRTKMKRSG
jgi:hypothetical protein